MVIRYYVLPVDGVFHVKREGKPQGAHREQARALAAARFMAGVEARNGRAAEVLADDGGGLRQVAEFLPRPTHAKGGAWIAD